MAEAAARPHSLRRRLTITMIGGLLAVMGAISLGLWNYANLAANRTYDLLLEGTAIAMLEGVTLGSDGIAVDIPPSALEILGLARQDRVFYRVFIAGPDLPAASAPSTLTGDEDLPLPPERGWLHKTIDGGEVFFDAPYSDEGVRFILRSKPLPGLARGQRIAVEVGQTRIARDALRHDMLLKGIAGLGALCLISLLLLRFAINRALRPLIGVAAKIDARDPGDLSAFPAQTPREIESLVGAINGFMHRLTVSRENAQSFIADVAHQMRSALAAVEGRLDHALSAADPAELRARTGRAHAQTQAAIALTNQMLSHAMVIHRADSRLTDRVELLPLIRSAVEELLRSRAGAEAEIELDLGPAPEGGFTLDGDAIALREALVNLAGNAIRHSGGRARLVIGLAACDTLGRPGLTLSVDDDGPGIPEEALAEIRDRFVARGDHAGSGIGLAIVEAVAESHHGQLRLERSPLGGLRAALDLPLSQEEMLP
ncbi:sensor histidine kinase [Thioclava sp. BHET1]|nr:sensor histidine kinase [Thioclava sp. BHET1]